MLHITQPPQRGSDAVRGGYQSDTRSDSRRAVAQDRGARSCHHQSCHGGAAERPCVAAGAGLFLFVSVHRLRFAPVGCCVCVLVAVRGFGGNGPLDGTLGLTARSTASPADYVAGETGSAKWKVAPRSTSPSAQVRPPCRATIRRTLANPMPVP